MTTTANEKFAIWATTYAYYLSVQSLDDYDQSIIDMERARAFDQFLQSSLEQTGNEAVPEIFVEWQEKLEGKRKKVTRGAITGLCEIGFLQNYTDMSLDECKARMMEILDKSISSKPNYLTIEAYKKS